MTQARFPMTHGCWYQWVNGILNPIARNGRAPSVCSDLDV